MSNTDRQKVHRKIHQKFSVIITNTFFLVFKTKSESKCKRIIFFNIFRSVYFDYWEFPTNFLTYFLKTVLDAVQNSSYGHNKASESINGYKRDKFSWEKQTRSNRVVFPWQLSFLWTSRNVDKLTIVELCGEKVKTCTNQ